MFAILGFLALVGTLVLWPVLRTRHLSAFFSGIKENDEREIVLQRMGSPWKREECGKYLGGYLPSCTEELIYAHPYAPYVPEYWVVDFNSSHRVISTAHLISP
jgi:hypothetical protein